MLKIKVPMRCKIEHLNPGPSFNDPYGLDNSIEIHLTPEAIHRKYNFSGDSSVDYVNIAFKEYMRKFQSINILTLYAIEHLLKSAKVDNAFDMLTLNKQLLPMLDEVIAQADPDNYELEIIK